MKQIPDLKSLLADFYRRIDKEISPDKNVKFHEDDFDITLFSQTFSSTALGFMGWGGQEVTEAYTTVIFYMPLGIYAIYFGGDFAYYVMNPNDRFYFDFGHLHMKSVWEHSEYESK